jgi:hypothetical protein
MLDEIERLRTNPSLFQLLSHYVRLAEPNRDIWQERLRLLEGVDSAELTSLHGRWMESGLTGWLRAPAPKLKKRRRMSRPRWSSYRGGNVRRRPLKLSLDVLLGPGSRPLSLRSSATLRAGYCPFKKLKSLLNADGRRGTFPATCHKDSRFD